MKREANGGEKGLKDLGIIFVSGEIGSGTAESVCREIIEANVKGELGHIQLIVNSPGGEVSAGFAIVDIIEWSRIPVYTTGIGIIASMGLMIFMTGQRGRRVITPRTSILSHRFWGIVGGNHSQLLASRKEQDLIHERIVNHYLSYTNIMSRKELEETLLKDVDTWLSAQEAMRYGLTDIVEPLREAHPGNGRFE